MSAIGKDLLLARRLGEYEVEVPGVGTVIVRALSRVEALELKGQEIELLEWERKVLAVAMVNPALTEDEVRQWQEVSPAGELEPVTSAVLDISGLNGEAAQEAYAQFRDAQRS